MTIQQQPQNFNPQDRTSPTILCTLDLIDQEIGYYQEQAVGLAELARWYDEQAQSRIAERRALAVEVYSALDEAERLLA